MNDAAAHGSPNIAATLEAWAFGFAAVRGYATPVETPTGLWIEIGQAEQKGRHIVRGFDVDRIRALASSIHERYVYLEIAAPRDDVAPLLSAGWTIRNPAFLMERPLVDEAEPAITLGAYELRTDDDGVITTVEIRDQTGEIAASGKGAFAAGGFVFDNIATHEAHRRRGLGSIVMRQLSAHAAACGVRRGLLIATPDGRALYEALGWTLVSPIASVISPI